MSDNQPAPARDQAADKGLPVNDLGRMLLSDIDHFPPHVQASIRAAHGIGPQGPFLPVYVPPLTLSEYLNAVRFPATTSEGLSPMDQLTEDAIRFRNLWEYFGNGGKLTTPKRAELMELMRKIPNQPRVMLELPTEGK